MPAVNRFFSDNLPIIIVIGILLVMAVLVTIAVLLNRNRTVHVETYVSTAFSDQITLLKQASTEYVQATIHHADVSAVVAMVAQLNKMDEDAIELLKSYPESVRAAAWLHYINSLGHDLQVAQQELSSANQRKGKYADDPLRYVNIGEARKTCQKHVDDVRQKLNKAVELSKQTGLRVV